MKNKRKKISIVIVLLVLAVIFSLFLYTDVLETTRHGITFWNALFSGKLKDFYVMNESVTVSEKFGVSTTGAVYDITIYLVFAIWNFPLWIYEKVSGACALDHLAGILWAKSISIPFIVGCFLIVKKAGEKIKGKAFDFYGSLLMMLSSVLFMTPVLLMGQYDAISLLFIMLGVYAYICENDRKFAFWFAVAVTFKTFALFVFIPLVLAKEKRLLRVLLELLEGCALLILCGVLKSVFFTVSDITQGFMTGHILPFLFQARAGFTYGGASVFAMAFLGVCMYCYFMVHLEKGQRGIWAIYISFLGLASFFVTCLTHPQWSLLLLPFMTLLIFTKEKPEQKTGMWIDTIASTGLLLAEFIYYSWVFNIKTSWFTLSGMLFYNGTDSLDYSIRALLTSLLTGIDIEYLNLIGGGIFAAGMLFFLYWANPKTSSGRFVALQMPERWIYGVRFLIVLAVTALLIGLMFVAK